MLITAAPSPCGLEEIPCAGAQGSGSPLLLGFGVFPAFEPFSLSPGKAGQWVLPLSAAARLSHQEQSKVLLAGVLGTSIEIPQTV